ncbi:thermonuclease family protein [Sedimenticola sp.]|uniref:thermonuclease family protein n=1 Tax=Sedimenticola sp. TaxID=1940285 RepID=UPI003D1139D2
MNHRILLLTGLITLGHIAHAEEGTRYPLAAIEDGDTITIQIGDKTKRLQLSGIDAPEDIVNPKLAKDRERTQLPADQLLALGQAATTHLKQLLAPGDEVTVVGDLGASDRYGRIPVFIYKGERSLNEAMIIDGYATVLSRSKIAAEIKNNLSTLQQQAQAAKRGLWGAYPEATLRWSGQSKPQ